MLTKWVAEVVGELLEKLAQKAAEVVWYSSKFDKKRK